MLKSLTLVAIFLVGALFGRYVIPSNSDLSQADAETSSKPVMSIHKIGQDYSPVDLWDLLATLKITEREDGGKGMTYYRNEYGLELEFFCETLTSIKIPSNAACQQQLNLPFEISGQDFDEVVAQLSKCGGRKISDDEFLLKNTEIRLLKDENQLSGLFFSPDKIRRQEIWGGLGYTVNKKENDNLRSVRRPVTDQR